MAGAWHAEPSAWLAGALRAGRIAAPTESAPDEIEVLGASVPGVIAVLDASVRDGNVEPDALVPGGIVALGASARGGHAVLGASVPGAHAVPGGRGPDELAPGPLGGSLIGLSSCAVARTVVG